MQFLLVSICCSVAVSILLKVARKQGIGLAQAIAVNYIVAAVLTVWWLNPSIHQWQQTMLPNWWLFVLLGILFPSVFIIMGRAVEVAGIVRSDAAQRLSLFLPVLAAFLIFGEQLSQQRLIGLVLAFIALLCLLYKPMTKTKGAIGGAYWLMGVFLGYGTIDILLKQLSKVNAIGGNLLVIFILAAIVMFSYLGMAKVRWRAADILGGLILGCLNFSNILFYILAHRFYHQQPTLVFVGMNIGVIVLGTVVGALFFKEKISKINALGIVLAVLAILCLYYLPLLLKTYL